jgi:hypothetical protein
MKIESGELEGAYLLSLENEVLKRANMASQLQRALEESRDFESQEFTLTRGDGEKRYFIRGQNIQRVSDEPYRLLLVFEET